MTHCYELIKEKSVMDSLDTGETQRAIQQERIHNANMMKENEKWNEEVDEAFFSLLLLVL